MGIFAKTKDRDTLVGIDINAEGIVMAIKTKNGNNGSVRIQCEYKEVPQGEQSANVLKDMVSHLNLQNKPTVMLLPTDKYSLLQTKSPAMPKNELRAAARWKVADLISYPVESAVVDIFEYPKAGQRGEERMLFVVASHEDAVRSKVDSAKSAHIDLAAIDIHELAIRNVVSHLPENKFGVIVLSMSERRGLLVLVKQDEIYLTRRLDVGYADLEGNSERVFDDIVLELQRSLDFFESQFSLALPSTLLVYPPDKFSGEFLLHINSNIPLHVEPLILEKLTDTVVNFSEESQSRCLTAVGAALRGPDEVVA